jgi:hypothetical protein
MLTAVTQGVLEFYKQLDLGPGDTTGEWPDDECGNLVC